MEPVSQNISSLIPMSQIAPSMSFNPAFGSINNQNFVNDIAAFIPNMSNAGTNFDLVMNNFASFRDIISVAQGGISQMKEQGESIRDLVAQAKEEGVTPELLDKIQAEVDSRVAEIQRIRDGAVLNGINAFDKFSLDIPDVLGLMGANNKEDVSNAISDMMASFDIDINIEGDGFSFGGKATIEIGYTEDGALQINVDASMDYDLSGLVGKGGVTSDNAFDMINNFINMLGVQQGDLGNAQNFLDAIFEQIFNTMMGAEESPEGIEIEQDSSDSLKGKIVQQASITLDGMAGQAPSIAINIL